MLLRPLRAVSVLGLLLAAGCASVDGEPRFAAPRRAPSSVAQTPSVTVDKHITRKISDTTIGSLEHPARLAGLFTRLSDLEEKRATTDVRMMQLGDSHTASDYGTSVVRARLVARFGDGGRGFIPLGPPYRRLFQAGEAVSKGIGFEPDEASLPPKKTGNEGLFGPAGFAMDGRAPGTSMTSELSARADRFEIAYLAQPSGGSFDVTVDGQNKGRVTTADPARASSFRAFEVTRGPHSLEVRAVGDGPVRLFGVRLDDDATGVTLDSLGMNGAKATTPLGTDEAHFAEQLAHIAPSLAILAYGTNESADSMTTPDDHAAALRALVERVRKGAPGVECIVLGPPDRDARAWPSPRTLPKLLEIIAAQRRAADDAGCAFYDQLGAMGGEGAIGRWSIESPPRARRDLVHLTRAGYTFLAEAFVRDVVGAYEGWKRDTAVAAR